jgi:uncharacterized membrane protein
MGGIGMGIFGWIIGILVITVLVLLIVFLSKEIDKRNKKK